MDRVDKVLDYSNMNSIPNYALYGEKEYAEQAHWLHWETITSRSQLHGYQIAPHRHEQFFQLLYVTGGQAEANIDGETIALRPGAVLTLPAMSVHGFTFSEDVEGAVITLFAREARALFEEIGEAGELFERPLAIAGHPNAPLVATMEGLVMTLSDNGVGQAAAVRARLMLVFVAMLREAVVASSPDRRRSGRAEELARRMRILVERGYRLTRSVPFYARSLAITPTHLNRVCRQVFGVSALGVIERRIILEARRYLEFSGLSVKEIGFLLGYPDPAYFTRFFARMTGETPSRFREKTS